MNKHIIQLSNDVIKKIAAGEVIERPASIIKELLDNAIDANSDTIKIELKNNGLDLIEITDNGEGIVYEESEKLFSKHATSKLSKFADLDIINTYGFRGEALASISAVADIKIHSYSKQSEPFTIISKNNLITKKIGPSRMPGTTVTVTNLFGRIPARKKFIRSAATEYKYTYQVIINLALSNNNVGFSLVKDGKTIFTLSKNQTPQERVANIFKSENSTQSFINFTNESNGIALSGFVQHPNKIGSKSIQKLFVNRRPVQDGLVSKAIKEGYGSTIPYKLNPNYILYIYIPGSEIDVNVHPRKSEIRFAQAHQVFITIKQTISNLLENYLQEELKSRLNYAKDQKNVTIETNEKSFSNAFINKLEFTKEILTNTNKLANEAQLSYDTSAIEEAITNFNYLQIFDTYILIERDEKLLIIDQHAAAERVTYENLLKEFATQAGISSQKLLVPEVLTLESDLVELMKESSEIIDKLGFEIQKFSGNSIQITAVPILLIQKNFLKSFNELLESFKDEAKNQEKIINSAIATIACHSSIRAGDKLEKSQVAKILSDLQKCKFPSSCPHGRPTIWEISKYELDKKFKRIQ